MPLNFTLNLKQVCESRTSEGQGWHPYLWNRKILNGVARVSMLLPATHILFAKRA